MIITAVFVHALATGSVEFGFGTFAWAIITLAADMLIAVATSNVR